MSDYIKSLEKRNEELTDKLETVCYYNKVYKKSLVNEGFEIKISFSGGKVDDREFKFTDHIWYPRGKKYTPGSYFLMDGFYNCSTLKEAIIKNIIYRLSFFKDINIVDIYLNNNKVYNNSVWGVCIIRDSGTDDWRIFNVVTRRRRKPVTNNRFKLTDLITYE